VCAIYYAKYAAAFVRGTIKQAGRSHGTGPVLAQMLLEKSLEELSEEEYNDIISAGKAAGLRLHRFKKPNEDLPRVRRILGFLKSIGAGSQPDVTRLLDVGSGRGVFLWPCMNAFPDLNVLSIDILPYRVDMLNTVKAGGIANLSAIEADIRTPPIADKSFDVVTMLEVLEHIPNPSATVVQAVRIAKHYIAVSVPSLPDNNPEHRHLLTKDILTDMFKRAGCTRLHFDGVPGHLILIAVITH